MKNPLERFRLEFDSLRDARKALPGFEDAHCQPGGRRALIYGVHPNGRDYFVEDDYIPSR